MIRFFTALALLLGLAVPAQAFDTAARAAYVVDQTTGTVLLAKNADTPLPPASMSKLMTLYMAFEAIREGRLSLNETLPVSEHAQSYGGSSMFLRAGERVKVEDLLRGIIVLSGNDACVVLAEALSPTGSESGFAQLMTQRAQKMGLTSSTFMNSNGWPQPGHLMSMRDLALLATRLIEDFGEFYPMFAEEEYAFDGRVPSNRFNRNPLLGLGIGADGLKTGHTEEAGYGLVGSAVQDGRRVIFAFSGLDSTAARAQEAQAIVNWAFRQFAEARLAPAGERLATADVWLGSQPAVGLVPTQDVTVLIPILSGNQVPAEIVYTGPVTAPIAQGQKIAELVVSPEGVEPRSFDLVAETAVPHGGFLARVKVAATQVFSRIQERTAGAL